MTQSPSKTLPTPHVRVERKTSRDVTRWDVWIVTSPTYVETFARCRTADEARHVARNVADARAIPFIDTRVSARCDCKAHPQCASCRRVVRCGEPVVIVRNGSLTGRLHDACAAPRHERITMTRALNWRA